jgi:hypothetical protein
MTTAPITLEDKLANALALEEEGEDGALYLQAACTFVELIKVGKMNGGEQLAREARRIQGVLAHEHMKMRMKFGEAA